MYNKKTEVLVTDSDREIRHCEAAPKCCPSCPDEIRKECGFWLYYTELEIWKQLHRRIEIGGNQCMITVRSIGSMVAKQTKEPSTTWLYSRINEILEELDYARFWGNGRMPGGDYEPRKPIAPRIYIVKNPETGVV